VIKNKNLSFGITKVNQFLTAKSFFVLIF